jgi:hypothetical protein
MMNYPNRRTTQAKSNCPTDPLSEALHLDRMSPEFLHLLQLRHVLFGGVLRGPFRDRTCVAMSVG